MRPSFAKPTFDAAVHRRTRAADVVLVSRLMRIITGALGFFDSSAGIIDVIVPVALLPKPPPVYSLMRTTSFGSRCSQRDTDPTVCTTLCVEQWMYSLPFCQYAIAVRGSSVWWLVFGVTNVSSSTSAAFLKPASTSP